MLARPWPNSSRSGSYRRPAAAMPSATFADSRLSSAASRATASAAENSIPNWDMSTVGREGVGSDPGSAPMRATSRPSMFATMVAAIRPASAPRPVVMPNASASGRATTPTVRPARTSTRQLVPTPA